MMFFKTFLRIKDQAKKGTFIVIYVKMKRFSPYNV